MNNRCTRLILLMLPLLLAACGTLLAPRLPPPEPWLPTQPLPDPGDRSPLYPQN